MKCLRSILTLLIFFGVAVVPFPLAAQVSVNVDPLDSVYRDIDKLVGQGLVDKIIVGQRPYSRREMARITGEAMLHLTRLSDPLKNPDLPEKKRRRLESRLAYVTPILERLKRNFQEELVQLGFLEGKTKWYSLHPLEQADIDFTLADSKPRNIPPNGLGQIDAVINPLLQYRQGRHVIDGSTTSLETVHWFRLTDYFAVYARPRFQLAFGRDDQPNDNDVYVQNLYGKFFIKNFEVQVGRDQVFWGQGKNAGLLTSNNPRGLDMIKISNDIPGYLPWVFKYMGAWKLSFFYSDLGPEQFYPNSYLTGFKVSLQPLSWFELGFSNLVISGGDGSPSASFGERVEAVFPFSQVTTGNQVEVDNKIGGFELRFRVPPAVNMEIYLEMMFDDTPGISKKKFFVDDTGYLGGLYFPRLVPSGRVDLRIEYHRTGIRYYRHPQFQSGWTLNQFILGDNLGPDAQGLYVTSSWDVNDDNYLTFNLAWEDRSNDIYESIMDPGLEFVKVQDLPNEKRYRFVAEWFHRNLNDLLNLRVQMGFERVNNFLFISGNDRNNFLGRVNLQWNFDRMTRFPRNYQ